MADHNFSKSSPQGNSMLDGVHIDTPSVCPACYGDREVSATYFEVIQYIAEHVRPLDSAEAERKALKIARRWELTGRMPCPDCEGEGK